MTPAEVLEQLLQEVMMPSVRDAAREFLEKYARKSGKEIPPESAVLLALAFCEGARFVHNRVCRALDVGAPDNGGSK